MATIAVTRISGGAAALGSPVASSSAPCPSSSSASCCTSSFRSQLGRREIESDIITGYGSTRDSCFQSLAGISIAGRRRRRVSRVGQRGSRVLQICAGSSEPGSNEPGSSEPGPSGTNGGDKKDENDMDLEASFRLQTTDWRAFRARLVKGANSLEPRKDEDPQRWAHALVEPEKGCLLIAHPTAFGTRQTYFNQAVIFLFEHDEDGSAGFILNRPTSYALGQVPGFEKFKPDFTESPLYMGGDVGTNMIQVIHGVPGLKDSKEVISGVYLGGPDAVNNSVKGGDTVPNDYRWFLGYCGWRPGQLEREVAHGVWYLASGSRDIVTNHCIRLKTPLWRQVLELMGGSASRVGAAAGQTVYYETAKESVRKVANCQYAHPNDQVSF